MIDSFQKATGIKVSLSTYGSNDEVLNRLRAARGQGFDVVMPSITYTPAWVEQELLQPLDESRINVVGVIPSMWDIGGTDSVSAVCRHTLRVLWCGRNNVLASS